MTATHRELAAGLPDVPRWVEVRDLLLGGEGQVLGLRVAPALAFVLANPDDNVVFVVGAPALEAVRAAVTGLGPGASVIAAPESADRLAQALPGWTRQRIILHTLADGSQLPSPDVGVVEFIDPKRLDSLALGHDLRDELLSASEYTQIAATLVDGQPVSFCYAGSRTETWWDISIDTLPGHRRQGYAGLCAAFMVRSLAAQGLQPVWAAVEGNPASWRLAQKLGFAPVDELAFHVR